MRILFLTPQLPFPPRQGTQIRNFHLLKAAASAHRVDLISFAREGESLEGAAPLLEMCGQVKLLPAPRRGGWSRLRALVASPEPDLAHRLPSAGFAATLRSMLERERYDAVQIEGIEMARYVAVARAAAPGAAIIFDDHNAEYLLQARAAAVDSRDPSAWPRALYSLIQWLKLRRYEAEVCRSVDLVLAVSEADAAALRGLAFHGLARPARVRVVPNGVDTRYYRAEGDTASNGASLLFTGTMDYRPNVDAVRWFVSSILPAVTACRPEATFQIVGRSPAPAVRRLASLHPRVVVAGPVEDVRPYFSRSDLFVVPIRMAGGARLKLLEALAMGLPVVSTRMGAEGIDLVEGKEIVIADGREEFARAVLRLLADRTLRARLAEAGRIAAEQRFDWEQVAPRLLDGYEEIAQEAQK